VLEVVMECHISNWTEHMFNNHSGRNHNSAWCGLAAWSAQLMADCISTH